MTKLRSDVKAELHETIKESVFQHMGNAWNGDRRQQRLVHDLELRIENLVAKMLTPPGKYEDEVEWGDFEVRKKGV